MRSLLKEAGNLNYYNVNAKKADSSHHLCISGPGTIGVEYQYMTSNGDIFVETCSDEWYARSTPIMSVPSCFTNR